MRRPSLKFCVEEMLCEQLEKVRVKVDDFRFMYTSKLWCKPRPNSCFLLTSLNWPAALQRAITVIFSLFSPDVQPRTFLALLSDITESCLSYICVPLFIHFENVSRCVRRVILGCHFLRHVKKYSNSVPVHSLISS